MPIDGDLNEWTASERLELPGSGSDGYELYGRVEGSGAEAKLVFAIRAPTGTTIGTGTTLWLNTDRDSGGSPATGQQVFEGAGFNGGGAEYNINFSSDGLPHLYTGADGENWVSGPIIHAFSAAKDVVEFEVPFALIGEKDGAVDVLVDVNNSIFLPNDYDLFTYSVVAANPYSISDAATVTEGGALEFTITRLFPTATDVLVTTSHGDVLMKAGDVSASLAVQTTDDAFWGAKPDVVVSLTGAFGTDTGTGHVLDDEQAPVYSISDAADVTEGGKLLFTVSRTTATAQDTVVTTDHGDVTILAGQTSAVLEVQTQDNANYGPNPDVVVSLTGAFGTDTGTGHVLDDEQAPVYSISDAADVTEGGKLLFTVSRTTATAQDTVVTTDHGDVTIPAGQTSAVLEVQTQDNANYGPNPDVVVSLTGTFGTDTGVGHVLDNEAPPPPVTPPVVDSGPVILNPGPVVVDPGPVTPVGKVLNGGRGGDVLQGDAGGDWLKGNAGNDKLFGNDGDDYLYGGLGKDVLSGGAGRDSFVLNTKAAKSNIDRVTDFNVFDDSIYLDNATFKALGNKGSINKPVQLKKAEFALGSKAADKSDHVIYNKKTGALFYDPDGTGSQAQVQIATLSKNLKMTHKDFFVI